MRRIRKIQFTVRLFGLLLAGTAYGHPMSDSTVVYYSRGRADVDLSVRGNHTELENFISGYREAVGNSTNRLVSFCIDAYASPDGTSVLNSTLSRRRAERLVEYLRQHIDLPDSLLSVRSHGVDWEGLEALAVAESELPYRDEVLRVLRDTPEWITDSRGRVVDGRKKQLGMLRGGVPYNWLLDHVFPRLRRSCIVLSYRAVPAEADTARAESAERRQPEATVTGDEHRETTPSVLPGGQEWKESANPSAEETFRPFLAVKTNLLAWATVMPDFHSYTFVPNLELEWFFARRWSLHGQGAYVKRSYRTERYFGLSSWSIEPRWWLTPDGRYRWLYVGVYGQAGDYDVQNSRQRLDGTTGKLWGAGFSVGVAVPFTERFGVEAGLRGGFRRADAREYMHEAGRWYLERAGKENHWGVTDLRLSVYYRFGKKGGKVE